MSGYKMTEQHKLKISKALTGKKHSIEWVKKCADGHRGRHHSEESKRKISQGNLGKKRTLEMRKRYSLCRTGNRFGPNVKRFLGHKHSLETKNRMSKLRRGDKHWNWRGGITPENIKIKNSIEFRLWRESVFARDNWICQKCFVKGGKLHPHHIKNFAQYPELRFALDNGITFCKECHIKFHEIYGRHNNNEQQIEEFLK